MLNKHFITDSSPKVRARSSIKWEAVFFLIVFPLLAWTAILFGALLAL